MPTATIEKQVEKKDFATESGHYYDAKTGEPRYTITGKNGKLRNTTLRDARTLGLVPSVTTITKILDKPGLKPYFRKQMFDSCLTTPRPVGMSDENFYDECCKWANEHASLAAEKGTAVHGAIERHAQGKTVEPEYFAHVNAVEIALEKVGIALSYGQSERSFAHPDGFGGKLDWSNETTVIDFKTKGEIKDEKKLVWDEHYMQLAAYAYGLSIVAPRCLNVFVGVTDCKIVVIEHDAADIARGLRMFKLCLFLWQEKNNYSPASTNDQ